MRNYEQESSKCLKQQLMVLYHRNMDSKSHKIDWSRGPLQNCWSTRIGAATYILIWSYMMTYMFGMASNQQPVYFFCRLILGKNTLRFTVRWPDLSERSCRSILCWMHSMRSILMSTRPQTSADCADLLIVAIWCEPRSQELPWFWRVSKEDSFSKFQVKGTVCSLQSSVKSLTVDDIYAAPGIPNLAAQIPRPRHDLTTLSIHIASPVLRWSEKSGFRIIHNLWHLSLVWQLCACMTQWNPEILLIPQGSDGDLQTTGAITAGVPAGNHPERLKCKVSPVQKAGRCQKTQVSIDENGTGHPDINWWSVQSHDPSRIRAKWLWIPWRLHVANSSA